MNVNESLTRMLMIKEYLWTNRLKNVRKIISIQTQKQKFWLNYMKHLEKKRWMFITPFQQIHLFTGFSKPVFQLTRSISLPHNSWGLKF